MTLADHVQALRGRATARWGPEGEDYLHEALLVAYETRAQPANPGGWLWVAARHRARCAMRKQRRAVLSDRIDSAVSEPFEASESHISTRSDLFHAREHIDPARVSILLGHVEGESYAELAKRLGVPIGTVMSRIYRARQEFRRLLGRQ